MYVLKRICLLIFCGILLLISNIGNAQKLKLNGIVVDENNKPLAGVSLKIKGKNIYQITQDNGGFVLDLNENDVLEISLLGFLKKEVIVSSKNNNLTIKLSSETKNLEDVVVVGYGTTRKKDLTGSVAVVTAKDFQKGQISTLEQMVAGKVPGVSIVSYGGQPGSGSEIRIRGGSSLRASNDPLIVIDGIPIENGSGSLSYVNPNDVESFVILKDASAAAIYGTRGSNGVILITTKKGTSGKLSINFTSSNSLSVITKKVDVLDAQQFADIVNQNGTSAQKAMLGNSNTNWQNEIFRNALSTDNNLSISGGIKKLPYRVSLGYTNQNGILLTDNLQRTTASFMLNPSLLKNHLKINLNVKGSAQNARWGNYGAIGGATSFDPTQPVYAIKNPSRFGGYYEWLDPSTATGLVNLASRNPVGLLMQQFDKGNPIRSLGNLQLDYAFHFLPELHANVNIGYDISKNTGTIFVSDSAASGYIAGGMGGQNNLYKSTRNNTLFDFYLNYIKNFQNNKSKIDATFGYSYNDYTTTNYFYASYTAQGVKYPNSDPTFPYDILTNRIISIFGRANFTYQNKYLITATFRNDASSRFAKENRWGLFPSFAFAWKLDEESFLKSAKNISSLKLRLGYGVTGQQDGINNYDYMSVYGLSNPSATYQFGNNFYQMYRPGGYNPNLKWEETQTTNIALDYGLFNNKISGSIDFYYRKTKDLLNSIPQPAGTNFSAYFIANVGSMENKGVEFSINTKIIEKKKINWDIDFNVTYNKNTITNLTVVPQDPKYKGISTGGIAGGIGGGFAQIHAVGYSRNTFNLYKQVYNEQGKPIETVFVDINGDGIINENDLNKSKSSVPDLLFGFSNNLSINKFTIGFVIRSSIGNYVYNNVFSTSGNLNQILGNAVLYNASTNYLETRFKGNNSNLLSDYYIQNASFLRMDNFNISYNAGNLFDKKTNIRLSASVQNVFVLTKYQGIDPEVSSGIDNTIYPRPRIFTLGISANF